jgi:hypothetical protein
MRTALGRAPVLSMACGREGTFLAFDASRVFES